MDRLEAVVMTALLDELLQLLHAPLLGLDALVQRLGSAIDRGKCSVQIVKGSDALCLQVDDGAADFLQLRRAVLLLPADRILAASLPFHAQIFRHLLEWSVLILAWWFCCPLITQTFAPAAVPIVIERTTGAYHGYMAVILFIGYLGVIVYNLMQPEREKRVNLPWILAIGVLVQFGWEAGLLLGGVRSAGFAAESALHTLAVNSLLETNLGMPYVYLIYAAYSARFTEQLRRRETPLTLTARIAENNRERVRG